MARNSIGKNLIITSFGESHGPSVGVIIDGFPSNIPFPYTYIQNELNKRKPGQNKLTTPRTEVDSFEVLSGVFNGNTTGAPICISIPQLNANTNEYESIKDVFRPGHADLTYTSKYTNRDYRGGGRSSARITAGWVAAGALAQWYLFNQLQTEFIAYVHQIGDVVSDVNANKIQKDAIENSLVRNPFVETSNQMEALILKAMETKDSLGGKIKLTIIQCPKNIGEPVFGKLNAILGYYLFSINAVKSIEFGESNTLISSFGSQVNDTPLPTLDGTFKTSHNFSNGMLGGIATGEEIAVYVGFKPTSSIGIAQNMLHTNGSIETKTIQGRHDPCVLPRAVPIVESMAALAILDLYLEK